MLTTNATGASPPTGSLGSPAIVARGLTKRFGAVTAVDDLTFEVRPGHVTGFLGPNGAGKSTTMRIVLGLVHPTAGSATVLGLPYASLDRPASVVGAVLEVQSFHPLRTGKNHLRMLAAASGFRDTRVDEVLETVDLTGAAGRKAGGYSLGMRQRLALAGALLGDPRVLVLDEPANGLDPQGIRWLREFLRWFAARGNAVLVSSHLLSEMDQMADEVVVIDRGRLVRQGAIADLTGGRSSLWVASRDHAALGRALIAAGLEPRPDRDEGYTVPGASADLVGEIALHAGVALTELTPRETTLEEAFLELTEGAER
ncbi:MAG TPA: ATP-binding cassette domain-containing protein [Actinomycetota bacterium]|nr:ATP-binding cassette domain-containing protein [Actinomycetota bacterium]